MFWHADSCVAACGRLSRLPSGQVCSIEQIRYITSSQGCVGFTLGVRAALHMKFSALHLELLNHIAAFPFRHLFSP